MTKNFYKINIYLLKENQKFLEPLYSSKYTSNINNKDDDKLFTSHKMSTSYGCKIYDYNINDETDPYSKKDKISKDKIIDENYGKCVITNICTNKNFDLTTKIKPFINAFNDTYNKIYYQIKTMQLTTQLYLQVAYISNDPIPALLILEYNEEKISISPSDYKIDYNRYERTYTNINDLKDNTTLLPILLLVDNDLKPLYQDDYMTNVIGDDLNNVTKLFTQKITYYMQKLTHYIDKNEINNKYFTRNGPIMYFDKLVILNLILNDLKDYNTYDKLKPITKTFLSNHPKTLNYLSKIINESEN